MKYDGHLYTVDNNSFRFEVDDLAELRRVLEEDYFLQCRYKDGPIHFVPVERIRDLIVIVVERPREGSIDIDAALKFKEDVLRRPPELGRISNKPHQFKPRGT